MKNFETSEDKNLVKRYAKLNTTSGWKRIQSDKLKYIYLPNKEFKTKTPYFLAVIYISLSETENALYWLEQTLKLKDPNLNMINVDPRFDKIRDNPRFQAIIKQLNFPS